MLDTFPGVISISRNINFSVLSELIIKCLLLILEAATFTLIMIEKEQL